MTHLDIRLLGPFEICRDGHPVTLPGRKVRALLAILALNCGRTVSFDTLGRALWSDDPPERLRGSLQTYVGRLRRVLGDQTVATEPTGYRLDITPESVDVLRFRELLDRSELDAALELWRGDPFGEPLSAWFKDHEAPALIERYLTACERRIDNEAATGQHLQRIPELHELTARFPLRETLWLRLLTALADAGRKAEALDRYETLRSRLADELGADPSPELQVLHQTLLEVRRPVAHSRRGLPHDLTRFFGRDEELAHVERSVRGSRLVTIAGPPGAGKTRLSREVATRIAPRFGDGVVLVELVSTSAETVLAEVIADADLLVILDNCEHIADAARRIAEQVLATYPSVRILTTSRLPLGVRGEQVFRLPPLARTSACDLFADRAALVSGDVPVDASTVDEICRKLDGLPLAIELAAAWSRVLSPRQILGRLAPLLQETHGTMRAALDWSYHLLSSPQQLLFERVAVFAGGFDLAAVEYVADLGDDLLGALTGLVDHSLVLTDRLPDGRIRYHLLEPVRQYAASILGEAPSVRARHAAHYLTVARRGDAALHGSERASAVIELQRDEGNLLAALSWARSQPGDLGLRLCTALAYFWENRGYVNDARARLEEFVDRGDPTLRATALARLGRLAWRQRDYAAARLAYQESLELHRQLGDESGTARALRNLALAAAATGETAEAVELCEQSIAMSRRLGDERGRGWALTVIGLTHYEDGDWAAGAACGREALEIGLATGGAALTVAGRLGTAYGAAVVGDVRTHREHVTAVVAELRKASGLIEDPEWLWASTSLAASEGRSLAALRLAGAATALSRRGGRMSDTTTIFCDAVVERLRQQVGARVADRLMAAGRQLTQDELMAEALAPPTPTDKPLTGRELEVAGLAGQGLSNDQIASTLVISRRTVESHLEHIRQKLDLASRYEIVAWALSRSG
ncbi:BTAD domain-containing putative transcriptional regulator [Kribbella sp. NPDC050281]|uniref:BTAD domain-containing putative transcriptional regulator n=1 Tax=Kribbella sp. NPDC050281 TaxID=3155515 RepID=UPI0033CD43CD